MQKRPNEPMHPNSRMRKYWDLISYRTTAELKAECLDTYLGFIWWFVEPLLFLSIYYVVFAIIMKTKTDNFVAFLFVGLVAWRWFQSCAVRSSKAIAMQKNLMNQVYISKLIFPLTSIFKDTFKFFLVFLCLLAFLLFFNFGINIHWLSLPILLATQLLFIIGVSLCFASITPFIPDLPFVIENCLRGLMFMSGVFFDISTLSAHAQFILKINPMADVLMNYRNVLISNKAPDWNSVIYTLVFGVIFMIIGTIIIRLNERTYPKVCA